MRAGGVGGRLCIVGLALTLLATLCLVAWITAARFQHLDEDLRRSGADSARDIAALALRPMRAADAPALQALASTITAAPGIRSAAFLDAQGRPIARAGTRFPDRAPPARDWKRASPAETLLELEGDALLVYAAVAERSPGHGEPAESAKPRRARGTLGWVRLELPRAATERAQTHVLVEGLGAVLLVLLAAAALAGRIGGGHRRGSRRPERTGPAAAAARVDATDRLEKALYRERLHGLKLERARRRAAAASRVKSTFLANMSHEIRTPMSGVLGYCDLLLKTRLNPAQLEFVRIIKSSTESLLGVVDGILNFSRTEAAAFRTEAREFDLRECVDDVLTLLAPSAQEKKLDIACLVSPYVPARVRGKAEGIRHILLNLASNAIKYTEHGSVVVRVTLTGEDRTGLTVLFSVTDTGPGIGADGRRNLFKAFHRTSPRAGRERGGTGLGLAVCKELVHSLGGEIGVESTPGCGSTFWFTAHCEKCEVSTATVTREPLQGRCALIYGPGAFTRSALREMLTRWGLQVEEAGGPAELAAHLEAPAGRAPTRDVVILDVSRNAGGEQLVQGVRARCDAPVVAILNAAEHEEAGRLGPMVSACLFKPVRHHALEATLKRVTSGRRAEARAAAPPAPGVPEGREAASHGLRVLLADDDEVCRRLLVLLLRGRGVRVCLAGDGHEAAERALGERFDAILMDLYMPGLDGAMVTQRIRAAEQPGQRTPIIALTADARPDTRRRLLAGGMDDCLVKPVSESELWEKLRRHARLERSEARSTDPRSAKEILVQELHALLLAELPARRTRINDALERADTAAIGFEAHALAGGAAYSAVPALKHASEALERAAAFGRLSTVARRVRRLNLEIDQLLNAGTEPPQTEAAGASPAQRGCGPRGWANVRLRTSASSRPSRAG